MACCTEAGLLGELKELVRQVGDGGCCPKPQPPCAPCCSTPCNFPFVQVTMTCPPPILAPTKPEPVKPLRLPCPYRKEDPPLTEEEMEFWRYSNFYNNYNIDFHTQGANKCGCCPAETTKKCRKPCEDYTKRNNECEDMPGCPTGFKPCKMKLTPPPCCDPNGTWLAQVQPCPPKRKKKSNKYVPGPCRRPCCKHWRPKEGPCLYDDPCKAHCFNHPPGMKPSGRFP